MTAAMQKTFMEYSLSSPGNISSRWQQGQVRRMT
jgi:hypothetical protein